MKIEKKCHPEYFKKILTGEKNFDLRLNDFSVNPGDILVLREWNPETGTYTGRSVRKKITYILNTKDLTFWNKDDIKKHGLIVMSLE